MADSSRTERVIVTSEPVAGEAVLAGRRTSWGAVFAGALLALMATLLLTLLAVGFGLQSIDPASERNPLAGFGTGTAIVTIVINLLALFLGGYVAGRLNASPRRSVRALHGLLAWGVLTLATLFLVGSAAGRLASGAASLVSNVTQGVATVTTDALQDASGALGSALDALDVQEVEQRVDAFLAEVDVQDPDAAANELVQVVQERLVAGDSLTSAAAQDELANVLTGATDLSEAEIAERVQAFGQELEQTAQQLVQEAEQAAGTAAEAAGTAALWSFVALAIGALVAAFGAAAASPRSPRERRKARTS